MSKVSDAFKEFEKVQSKFGDTGRRTPSRTESRRSTSGGSWGLEPSRQRFRDREGLELYTASMDCTPAVDPLTAALTTLADKLKALWFDSPEVRDEIKDYLWRCE